MSAMQSVVAQSKIIGSASVERDKSWSRGVGLLDQMVMHVKLLFHYVFKLQ
jgi:hypothetical protein